MFLFKHKDKLRKLFIQHLCITLSFDTREREKNLTDIEIMNNKNGTFQTGVLQYILNC